MTHTSTPHWPTVPWRPPLHPQYSTVQPFVYRDTLNMLTWLRAVACNLDTLREAINRYGEQSGEMYDRLVAGLDALRKEFDGLYAQNISQWLAENMPGIIGDAVDEAIRAVFFGLTEDGRFCAYVPKNWAAYMEFDTNANYGDEEYGCLILKY